MNDRAWIGETCRLDQNPPEERDFFTFPLPVQIVDGFDQAAVERAAHAFAAE